MIFRRSRLLVEDTSLGVFTSFNQRYQRLLFVLELLPIRIILSLGSSFSLSVKKLYPQFSSLSTLNFELCQYAKLHRVHLSPTVNNQASAHFELVHYDVYGPCPVMSFIGFKYFITFVDYFSHVT